MFPSQISSLCFIICELFNLYSFDINNSDKDILITIIKRD